VAIELKSSSKLEPDPLQQYKLDQIEDAGGLAITITPENWPEAFESLQAMAYGAKPDRH
jgi:hypothetical protein